MRAAPTRIITRRITSAHDAPEENPVLEVRRHREGREDEAEDEDVVDRERFLDQVAAEVLDRLVRALPDQDDEPEAEAQADPEGGCDRRRPQRDLARLPVEDEEVEGEEGADDGQEADPEGRRDRFGHGGPILRAHPEMGPAGDQTRRPGLRPMTAFPTGPGTRPRLSGPAPIPPGATIGILGGGQLGRMLGFAARALGYRVAVMDPDPDCPAASVADRVVVAAYDSAEGAVELARGCAVVTYELEHVDAALVDAVEAAGVPVRPGAFALRMTQDRLAERRFVAGLGIATAPWREVTDEAGLRAAAADLGFPLRLKAPIGGYDGRGQVRIAAPDEIPGALGRLGRPPGASLIVERELDFAAELSVILARAIDGTLASFPVARNRHDAGILVESVAPAPVALPSGGGAALGARIAEALGAVGLVTAELFLLRDGSLAVNELAPRVHNSGHWTIEGARTSQFEQHVRAVCGLPLGDPAAHGPTATVNVLCAGEPRDARLEGAAEALADALVHLHLYDKRLVFERRKMGHLTVAGAADVEAGLARGWAAVAKLRWA
jgi:5-(carboxyamino)imidazole ribonucleotide synthase